MHNLLGKIEGRRRRGHQMAGWHHWLNGHGFQRSLGNGEGQGSPACWVHGATKSWMQQSDWTTAKYNFINLWASCLVAGLLFFSHQVKPPSCVWLFATPQTCSTPGLPVLHYLCSFKKIMSIESVMPSNPLILCHPLSFCLQYFPAPRYFPMSWLFASQLA